MGGRVHWDALEDKPNQKGESTSDAEKLLNYLVYIPVKYYGLDVVTTVFWTN